MTKLTKGDFLSVLSSKSPQEIEDYIKKNGKIKKSGTADIKSKILIMEEKTMAVKKVEDLMKELSEKGSKRPSAKDETQIMMGILNDTSFKVTTNVTKECAGEMHCPAELF